MNISDLYGQDPRLGMANQQQQDLRNLQKNAFIQTLGSLGQAPNTKPSENEELLLLLESDE